MRDPLVPAQLVANGSNVPVPELSMGHFVQVRFVRLLKIVPSPLSVNDGAVVCPGFDTHKMRSVLVFNVVPTLPPPRLIFHAEVGPL